MFNQMFVGNPMYPAALIWGEHNYVDVGDVAAVHTEALEVREACGQHFVIASRKRSAAYNSYCSPDFGHHTEWLTSQD